MDSLWSDNWRNIRILRVLALDLLFQRHRFDIDRDIAFPSATQCIAGEQH